jgi:hypothetical protein
VAFRPWKTHEKRIIVWWERDCPLCGETGKNETFAIHSARLHRVLSIIEFEIPRFLSAALKRGREETADADHDHVGVLPSIQEISWKSSGVVWARSDLNARPTGVFGFPYEPVALTELPAQWL